jgi:membrane protease YdiL (CAAX protease family)
VGVARVDKNTKGVLVYLITAFAISWANLATVVIAGLSPGTRGFQLGTLPAVFAPAIAAFVVRKWVTGEGFSDAGLAPNVRKSWRYYLFGWFFPVAVVLLIFPLAAALGAGLPLPLPAHIVLGLVLLPAELLIGPLAGLAGAWGEEFGWRGYLQVRLFSDRPVLAAFATGFIWGVWHTPLYLRARLPPGELFLSLLVMFTGTVLGSTILGWLRLRTGSVWPAALYHAANNSASDSATLATILYALAWRGWDWHTASMVLQCMAVGAFCAWLVLSGQLRKETGGEQAR